MQNGIHFISGLPRAGSTLLAALLRQNPRFSAGMSSPVNALFNAMLRETSQRNEGAVFIDGAQRGRLLRACFEAFYARSTRGRSCSTPTAAGPRNCRLWPNCSHGRE